MAPRRAPVPRPVAAGLLGILVVALVLAGCSRGDARADLEALVGAVPADAVRRGLFLSLGEDRSAAFPLSLPETGLADVLGVEPEAVAATAETGGDPFTVLAGDIRPGAVVAAAEPHGYVSRELGEWTVLRHEGTAATAAVAAMPAVAVRAGVLVVGGAGEVASLVDGAAAADELGWVDRIVAALPAGVRAVALGGPPAALRDAEDPGGLDAAALLERAGTTLPAYEGYALVWRTPEGDEAEDGSILLARPRGEATPEDAAALALRAATGPLLGEGRRSAADLLDGGAPRVDRDAGIVRLPVRWLVGAPADLRGDVEANRLTFLAPSAGR